MKLCPKCDPDMPAVCDFCRHYSFNGDEDGTYTGEGYCNFHKEPREPYDGCDDFHCNNADDFSRP